jgi:hypothetical protein
VKANELRIGNWVYDGEMKRICVIAEVREETVKLDPTPYAATRLKWLMPIPLTPDILEKAGFKKDRTGFALPDRMSLSFSVTKDGEYLACWLDKSLGVIVKYLHQLQNLYFALTGNELEVN